MKRPPLAILLPHAQPSGILWLAALGLLAAASFQPAVAQPTTFQGPDGALWGDPTSWNNGVPNSNTAAATFQSPPGDWQVDLGGGTFTVNQVYFTASPSSDYSFFHGTLIMDGTNAAIATGGVGIHRFDSTPALFHLQLNTTTEFHLGSPGNGIIVAPTTPGSYVITGTGGITTKGVGVLEIQSANDYTGLTMVENGILAIGHALALGSDSSGTYVSGGTLEFRGASGITVSSEELFLGGTGYNLLGALRNTANSNAYNGDINLVSAATIVSTGGTLTLGGRIEGSNIPLTIEVAAGSNVTVNGSLYLGFGSLTKEGAGKLTLNLPSVDLRGSTTINAGTLEVLSGTSLGSSTVGISNGGVLELNGTFAIPLKIGAMTGNGTGAGNIITTGNVNLNGTDVLWGSGVFGGTGTIRVSSRLQGGTLTTTGSVTFLAEEFYQMTATTIGAGTIFRTLIPEVYTGGSVMTVNGTFDLNGQEQTIVSLSGSGQVTHNASYLNVNHTLPTPADFTGTLTGGGALYKSGTGTQILSGNNSGFTGSVVVRGGTLLAGTNTSIGSGGVTLWNGTTFGGSVGSRTFSNPFTIQGGVTFSPGGSLAELTLSGGVNLDGAGRIFTIATPSGINQLTVNGVISNDGGGGLSLVRQGTGASFVEFTGTTTNTYTGKTTVGTSVSLFLNKTATVVSVPGDLEVATSGKVTVETNEQIADSARVDVNGTGILQLGNGAGRTETIGSLYGDGTVQINYTSFSSHLIVGAGNFSGAITDGTATNGRLTKVGPGTLILSGTNSYGGSLTLQGGILSVGANANLGSGNITFEGGSLLATGTFSSNRVVNIGPGGGRILVEAGDTLTLTRPTFNQIGGTQSLNFGDAAYTGTIVITGDSLASGAATLDGGKLIVDGSLASTSLTVAGGTTLGGSGSIAGRVTLETSAHLAPGSSPGLLEVGELDLNSGSELDFELGSPLGTAGIDSDLLDVDGDIIRLDGLLNVTGLTGFGAGSYRLIDYGGSLLLDKDLEFGTLPTGYFYSLDTTSPGAINLLVTSSAGQSLYWNGAVTEPDGTIHGGNGNWTNEGLNWTSSSGYGSASWDSGDAVFAGSTGIVTIPNGESIQYTELRFSVNGYEITRTGSGELAPIGEASLRVDSGLSAAISAPITGAGGLSKDGLGTLTLSASNTFTGNINLNEGTLLVSANDPFDSSGVLTLADGVTLGIANLTFAVIDTQVSIEGDISMTAPGGGVLELAGPIALGSTARSVTLLGNSVINLQGAIAGTGGLNILASNPSASPVLQMAGLSNSYTGLTRIGNGVTLYLTKQAEAVAILGDIQIDAGGVLISEDYGVNVTQISPNSNVEVNGELMLVGVSGDFQQTFTGLTGSGFVTNDPGNFSGDYNLALTLGSGNFAGTIREASGAGALSLIKETSGTLILSGANTYTGATAINEGVLRINGALTASNISLSAGGILGGTGTISGTVTVNDGAVAPGASAGTLTTGALTLGEDSILSYELGTPGVVGGGSNDLLVVTGNLTLDGSLNITNLGGFGVGTYQLVNFTGGLTDEGLTVGSFPSGYDIEVDLAMPNWVNIEVTELEMQYWDGEETDPNEVIDGGDGTWDNDITNWTNSTGVANGPWLGRGAIFGGLAAGTVSVTEDVDFRQLVFELDGYKIEGAGGALVTKLNAGLDAAVNVEAEISAVIGGIGGIEKTGAGTVILSGANTYTGDTNVVGGTLLVNNADPFDATGTLRLGGGTTFGAADSVSAVVDNRTVIQGDIALTSNLGELRFTNQVDLETSAKAITLAGDSAVLMHGSIIGNGGLAVLSADVSGSLRPVLEMGGTANNTYTGLTRVGEFATLFLFKKSGGLAINGDIQIDENGTLVLVDDIGSSAPQIAETSNATVNGELLLAAFESGFSQTLASLNGSGFVTNGNTSLPKLYEFNLIVGSGDFTGILQEEAGAKNLSLTKAGIGTLRLGGANTYRGNTTITGGRLVADHNSAFGGGSVNARNSGSLVEISRGISIGNQINLSNGAGLLNYGTIRNSVKGITGSSLITNYGTINGNVALSGAANRVSLSSGSRISGGLNMGGNSGSQLTLFGSGSSRTSQAIGGSLSFNGTLVKTGSGTWIVDTTLPSRNVAIAQGTLQVGNGGSAGTLTGTRNIVNNGTLAFDKKSVTTFGGSISGSGKLVQEGSSNTILLGNNTYKGGTRINDGALTIGGKGTLPGNVVNQGDLYFKRSGDYQYKGMIKGKGDFYQDSNNATMILGQQKYTGTTYVKDGMLILGNGKVKSSLKGDVIVSKGAMFGGTGAVQGNIIYKGSGNPGNSPGTLTVGKNLTLESTASLTIEVESDNVFDQIIVGGKAKLGGTLRLDVLDGIEPEEGAEFDIITAKRITGRFSDVLAPDGWNLVYDSNQLSLVFGDGREPYQFYARGSNQHNVAIALETLRTRDLGTDSDFNRNVRPVLDTLAPEQLRQAFQAIMPMQAVAFSQTLFARSKSFLPQMQARLADIRAGASGFSSTGLDIAQSGAADMKDVLAPVPENKWGVWVDASGVFNQTASVANLGRGNGSSAAGTVGVDYRLSDNFITGFYTGYIGTWTNYGSGSEVDSNGSRFGMYSTYQTGGFYLNNLIGGEWNAYDWKRRILFPGMDRRATADTTGTVFETMFGGGYDWDVTSNATIGLFSNLEYTLMFVDGFTEAGAGSLNLRVNDQSADSLRSNLGIQAACAIPVGTRQLRPSLRAAWRHEYLDGGNRISNSLAGGAGPGFSTRLPGTDRRDSLLLNGGFAMDLTDNVSGYLYYTGDLGPDASENIHSVNAGLRVQF